MEKVKDLLTNEEFIKQRINQKFASSVNRIRFYNLKAKRLRLQKAFVDKPLHKNLYILEELMQGKKKASFHKEYLKGKGFSFGVNTHIDNYEGKQVFALYNYLFMSLDNDTVKIVRND